MRCLALAQAWQDAGGTCMFAAAQLPPALCERLVTGCFQLEQRHVEPGSEADMAWTIEVAALARTDWIILDGYGFGSDFQRCLKENGQRVLVIDDYGHADHYEADVVLNQNLHARPDLYARRAPFTELLLGPRYALLRREFQSHRRWERSVPEVARKVLVTLGGSDPDNVTLKVMRALSLIRLEGLEATVVVGASNPHLAQLRQEAVSARFPLQLWSNVSDMPALFAWADIAVSAGGATSWELAFFGLPGLTFILAENQRPVAESCAACGLVRNLSSPELVSAADLAREMTALLNNGNARAEMARRGSELVDGRGAERVVGRMTRPVAEDLLLRAARPDDCRRVWEWANDPAVRAASFSGEPIPWERHCDWFTRKLTDPRCVFYLATDSKGDALGQVRFDVGADDSKAVISVSLAPDRRGRGLGTKMIRSATDKILTTKHVQSVLALIKEGNLPSRLAFLKAGYVEDGTTTVNGLPAWRLVSGKELA
jgi:UDP-2,4-diacetamido-2,4,6-trideoxy-beta-L-altropyranose hydrolase